MQFSQILFCRTQSRGNQGNWNFEISMASSDMPWYDRRGRLNLASRYRGEGILPLCREAVPASLCRTTRARRPRYERQCKRKHAWEPAQYANQTGLVAGSAKCPERRTIRSDGRVKHWSQLPLFAHATDISWCKNKLYKDVILILLKIRRWIIAPILLKNFAIKVYSSFFPHAHHWLVIIAITEKILHKNLEKCKITL